MKALILGGAACVWDDLRTLGPYGDIVIAVNDIGAVYPHRIDHWATLHGEKLPDWSAKRVVRGYNTDYTTWTRPEKPGQTDRVLSGWSSGSSGFLAVGVALEVGATEVVLAGVPMDGSPHFFDREGWKGFLAHRAAWERKADDLRGRVFSMSGWTRRLLGSPPWLTAKGAA